MSLRLIKIPAWFFSVISDWLLIGTILAYVLSRLWPSSVNSFSLLSFIFVIFLIPANIVGNGFINTFFPNGNFGMVIWLMLLLIIFSGSVYLIKKK